MKHIYPLNGRQWLWLFFSALVWCWLWIFRFERDHSWLVVLLQASIIFGLSFLVMQATLARLDYPLTLIIKTSGIKKGSPEDHALFGKLRHLFKDSFPKDSQIKFDGFDCNDQQFWFYFKGAEPDIIQQALVPLLKDLPTRPGSHFLVRTATGQTAESPLPVTT